MRLRLMRFVVLMTVMPAAASSQTAAAAKKEPSAYDKIWGKFTEWYADDTNPVVQRVLLSGRFHYDFATIDSDQGDHDEWNVRRLRIGPRITLFRKFTFHAELELDPQRHDPVVRAVYRSLSDVDEEPSVRADGRQAERPLYGGRCDVITRTAHDRSEQSRQQHLVSAGIHPRRQRLGAARTMGLSRGSLLVGRNEPGIGGVHWRHSHAWSAGYDFAQKIGAKEALLTGNYVYQTADELNTFTRQLAHIGSINFRFEETKWGARMDLSTAAGYLGQSDMWAFQGMPFVNVTSKLQVVGRYTFIASDDHNGIRLATYESRIVSGKGDEYNEVYIGANYYFYGHRLKLQSGVQFAEMEDRANDGGAYSGVAWTTGLRVGW